MPAPRKLTPDQEGMLIERYRLYLVNRPKAIARDLGIAPRTLHDYVRRWTAEGRIPGRRH